MLFLERVNTFLQAKVLDEGLAEEGAGATELRLSSAVLKECQNAEIQVTDLSFSLGKISFPINEPSNIFNSKLKLPSNSPRKATITDTVASNKFRLSIVSE